MKTIEKPWGSEEILENNGKYVLKRLKMLKGKRCSLQYHEKKIETIYIISGKLKITIGDKYDIYQQNDFITINNNIIHRMEGITDCLYLETSTCELDDVKRIEDDYGR